MKLKIRKGRAFLSKKVQARVVKPLYGHDSPNNAYVVEDYPYGSMRTQKRFWLEYKPNKGFRFVGQTLNPKNQRWNKPKASTYGLLGGAMYLDEKGHVQWSSISEYSNDEQVLEFVQDFPKANFAELKKFAPAKIRFLEGRLSGKVVMTVNNKPVEMTETDKQRTTNELAIWKQVQQRI